MRAEIGGPSLPVSALGREVGVSCLAVGARMLEVGGAAREVGAGFLEVGMARRPVFSAGREVFLAKIPAVSVRRPPGSLGILEVDPGEETFLPSHTLRPRGLVAQLEDLARQAAKTPVNEEVNPYE